MSNTSKFLWGDDLEEGRVDVPTPDDLLKALEKLEKLEKLNVVKTAVSVLRGAATRRSVQ